MRPRSLAVVLLVAAGCGPSFDPPSYVKGLRVLAVEADPPELAPGEQTTLRLLITDGNDDATIEWATCTRPTYPGAGFINPDCTKETPEPWLIPLGTERTLRFTMPNVDPLSGQLGLPDGTSGFYVPIRAIVRSGTEKIMTFYRLRVLLPIAPQPPNRNPVLTEMTTIPYTDADAGFAGEPFPLVEGEPLEVKAGVRIALSAAVTPDSIESYTRLAGDPRDMKLETVNEVVRFFWFTSAGEYEREITGPERPITTLDLSKRPPSAIPAMVDLYLVARDERGGTTWLKRQLHVVR
jgi:hypothetical protein